MIEEYLSQVVGYSELQIILKCTKNVHESGTDCFYLVSPEARLEVVVV